MTHHYAHRMGLPPMPDRIRSLAVSDKGYPVPFFVQWLDGVPDFRIVDPSKFIRCVKHDLCWICGQKLGRHKTFVAGPISGVTRVSGEPPSHHDCATFAAMACPFLVLPRAKRRDANMPDETKMLDGHLDRNPGVAMLWTCDAFRIVASHDRGDPLIVMHEPLKVEWYAQGRPATRAEVIASVTTGMPLLTDASITATGMPIVLSLERLQAHYPQ
jgi:hypothetical protein